jgi:anti-anti-sigma factor
VRQARLLLPAPAGPPRGRPTLAVSSLEVSLTSRPGQLVMEMRGELDLDTVTMAQHWFDAVANTLPGVFVVDFAAVTYLDSTALTMLVRWAAVVAERGGILTLINVDRHVGRPIAITQLDRVLHVHWTGGDTDTPALG